MRACCVVVVEHGDDVVRPRASEEEDVLEVSAEECVEDSDVNVMWKNNEHCQTSTSLS